MGNRKIVFLFLFCLPAGLISFIDVSLKEGSINSVEDIVKIEVKTNESPVYGIFSRDDGLALYARIYGNKKKLSDNIDLSEQKVIELKGKGKFLIELYALKGKGNWKCNFVSEKEFKKMNIQ